MSYIENEASKHQSTVDIIKEEIEKVNPADIEDANSIGNLLGATTSAFSNLAGLVQSTPQGKAITIAITATNGTILNYGITVAKDGESSFKAVFTGASSAVVSIATAEVLAASLLRTVAVGALATAGAPVAITVIAGAGIVAASYFAGNYASAYAGELWDYFFGEEVQANKEEVKTIIPKEEIQDNEIVKKYIENDDKTIVTDDNTNISYNITSVTSNLEMRNALEYMPEVSVLLSEIDIKVGDVLDIGDKGTYTVKDGDTFSEIANSKDINLTTKELLLLNTWLIDEGKVTFNQDKILVELNTKDLGELNHTLMGTDADDILRDLNGGDDVLVGGQSTNILDGGEGNDTVSYSNASTGINVENPGTVY